MISGNYFFTVLVQKVINSPSIMVYFSKSQQIVVICGRHLIGLWWMKINRGSKLLVVYFVRKKYIRSRRKVHLHTHAFRRQAKLAQPVYARCVMREVSGSILPSYSSPLYSFSLYRNLYTVRFIMILINFLSCFYCSLLDIFI